MTNKAIIADGNQFTDKGVALNFALMTNHNALLYLYKWPDKRVVSDLATIQVHWLHYFHPFTKSHIDNTHFFDYRTNCHFSGFIVGYNFTSASKLSIST